MMRRILLGLSLAAPLAFGAAAAQAQVIVGDVGQSSNQSLASKQSGGSTQNSHNSADSGQAAEAQLILGDTDQAGEQSIGSDQTGGGHQNSTNTATNAQSVGPVGGSPIIIIGDTTQGNTQSLGSAQSTKKGVQDSVNSATNAQLIASDLILGETEQDNTQKVSSSQSAISSASSGSTIVIAGLGTIKIPDELPSIDVPPVAINPAGGSTTQSSHNELSNSQLILGG